MSWSGWISAAFFAALFLAQTAAATGRAPGADADLLPGWQSETYQPAAKPKVPRMITLDAEARIFLFEHFLTDEECDYIIGLAEPSIARSSVVKVGAGSEISNYRTSHGMFLTRGHDKVIADIEQRIARWTLLPVGNGEGLQVLRYMPNQEYGAHADYFEETDKANIARGGNRFATVLMYLNDVEEGGETCFPNVPAPGGDNGPSFSDCARHCLAAKPKKGSAVLFHSIKPSGEFEPRSVHTACPVIRGVKWSAPKWIRVGHFTTPEEEAQKKFAGGCANLDEMCGTWAAQGECQRNSVFMVGTRTIPGNCLVSCNRCDLVGGFRRSSMM